MFAEIHARTGDAVCCAGMLVDATLCAAHARLSERREWVHNEKRLVQRAGLDPVEPLVARPGGTPAELAVTVAAVGDVLGLAPVRPR
jgi:hypothetical protein